MSVLSLHALITERRDDILAHFVEEVRRRDLAPAGLSRSLLVDHLPRFLDEIVEELACRNEPPHHQDADDTSETARRHGSQRHDLGYDLEGLVREYGVLRHAILATAKQCNAQLSIDEFDVLAKCLNVGVAEAVMAYVAYQDQELNVQHVERLFLAEAGELLTSSLDVSSTLQRLTKLIVPQLADWCAVHVEGRDVASMPIAHVDPQKVEALRAIYHLFPPEEEASYGLAVALRTGQSQRIEEVSHETLEAAAQNEEHLALLRKIASCSWMLVPLRVQTTVFGAVTFGHSESGRHFSASDLLLAEELARRAAVAIDNARLYELSQRERSRVEAATRAKEEFVAMVSHELRTPLNAITGWTRLLRTSALPEAKRAHALEVIERNAAAQNQLVSDLLDSSRILTGKIRLTPTQVDLASLVDQVIDGMHPAAEAKRVTVTADLDRSQSMLRADSDRLQQIVWNLLSNAVKFTPKGGAIAVTLRRVESDLELSVCDNGEGIPADFLPQIFERFRQLEASSKRTHGGLGLGLSIAKHLVELHGGSLTAQSEGPGRGATFLVRLPISPVVTMALETPVIPATKQVTGSAMLPTGLDDLRVLLVDDDHDARELLEFVLGSCGMVVRTCTSAAEALRELDTFQPNVVVSDIGMPGEDGYALIRRIRTHPSTELRQIGAIALTALARNEDRTRALVEGFNVHLIKPVEPVVLVAAVVDVANRP